MARDRGIGTRAVHGGLPEPQQRCPAVPIILAEAERPFGEHIAAHPILFAEEELRRWNGEGQ